MFRTCKNDSEPTAASRRVSGNEFQTMTTYANSIGKGKGTWIYIAP